MTDAALTECVRRRLGTATTPPHAEVVACLIDDLLAWVSPRHRRRFTGRAIAAIGTAVGTLFVDGLTPLVTLLYDIVRDDDVECRRGLHGGRRRGADPNSRRSD